MNSIKNHKKYQQLLRESFKFPFIVHQNFDGVTFKRETIENVTHQYTISYYTMNDLLDKREPEHILKMIHNYAN